MPASIRISTKLDSRGAVKGAKEVENAMKKLQSDIQALNDLSVFNDNSVKSTKQIIETFNALEKSTQKTTQRVKEMTKELEHLQDKADAIEESTARKAAKQIPNAKQELIERNMRASYIRRGMTDEEADDQIIMDRRNKLLDKNTEYKSILKQIDSITADLQTQNALLDEQNAKLKTANDAVQERKYFLESELAKASEPSEKGGVVKGIFGKVKTKLGGFGKWILSKRESILGGATSEIGSFGKGLMKVGLMVAGIKSSFMLIKGTIGQAIQQTEKLKNTMSAIQQVGVAAVQPLAEGFVSALAKAVSYAAAIYKFFTGINLIAKANAKLAQQEADSRGPAKFDEVDVLQNGSGGTDNTLKQIELSEKLKNILNIIKSIWDTIKSKIKEAWDENGNGTRIMAALNEQAGDLYNWFDGLLEITQRWADALDLGPLLESIAGYAESLTPIFQDIEEILTWIYENVVLPFVKYVLEDFGPSFLNLMTSINNLLDTLYQTILKPLWDFVWEKIISPLIGTTGDKVVSLLDTTSEGIQKITDYTNAHKEEIQAFITKLGELVDNITSSVKKLWEMIKGAWNWIANTFSNIGAWVMTHITNPIFNAFSTMSQTIPGIFKSVVNGVISAVESCVNFVIDGINAFTWGAREVASFAGININPIGHISVPRLAKGAVIPPNNEFMAVLGDQKSGTNIETPEDLMRQIVREEAGAGNAEVIRLLRIIAAKELKITKSQVGSASVDYINGETERTGNSPLVLSM